MRLSLQLVLLFTLSLLAVPLHADGTSFFSSLAQKVNPVSMVRTAKTNWREGRFYATDLTQHPTWQTALKRSLAPVDMKANVNAAVLNNIHPVKLLGKIIDPLGIELQRQIASGQGLDFHRLARALDPRMIAATAVGGAAGDIAGAVVQSTLARFGPVGAAAGFFIKPAMGFAGQVFGMNVGDSMVNGNMSLKGALASALRQIKPGRDTGQMMGGVLGYTFGQVLIPIPIVGGIVGGLIGGTVGALLGNSLSHVWPFNHIENALTSFLHKIADKLDPPKAQQPEPPKPASEGTSGPRPQPQSAFKNPLADVEPSYDDLPVGTR